MTPRFMDPPPAPPAQAWAATVDTLIEHTGQWALIFKGTAREAGSLAGLIHHSRGAWHGHHWEGRTQTVPGTHPKVVEVYARHVQRWGLPVVPVDERGWAPPDGINDLIRRNLVSTTEIAERVGTTHSHVAMWVKRYARLSQLVVTYAGNRPLFWWPQVNEALAELNLPYKGGRRNKIDGGAQ